MRAPLSLLVCRLPFFVVLALGALRAQSGYDSGGHPLEVVERLGLKDEAGPDQIGRWLRLRGLSNAPVWPESSAGESASGDDPKLEAEIFAIREALRKLRHAGYENVALIWWNRNWTSEMRPGITFGSRAPLDLREAFFRAERFARTYGDLITAWEVENEVDLFFADTADVFTAYYKAVALGIAEGRAEGRIEREGLVENGVGAVRLALASSPLVRSRVVMPAMGLPPGPFLEQCLANGFLSYVEGANLHYYGFWENYADAHARLREELESGVHIAAASSICTIGAPVGRGSGRPADRGSTWRVPGPGFRPYPFGVPKPRDLPVFVTEWGYPRMDGVEAQTVEGRVRQWRHYREMQAINQRLGVEAPMAFYLPPYFEYGAKEFGLTMPPAEKRAAHYGFVVEPEGRAAGGADPGGTRTDGGEEGGGRNTKPGGVGSGPGAEVDAGGPQRFTAGGLTFTPADFGAKRAEPWMLRIGERIGGAEASPALAWLMARAEASRARGAGAEPEPAEVRVKAWRVRTEPPSPVVVDFVAGEGTLAVKSFHGYFLQGEERGGEKRGLRAGRGKLVLYNFGSAAAELCGRWPEGVRAEDAVAAGVADGGQECWRLTLAPGERREIAVTLSVEDARFWAVERSLAIEVRGGGGRPTVARWATRVYPSPDGHAPQEARSFFFPEAEARGNREWLEARPHAEEEARLQRDGRWLVSPGVRVEETDSGWRFHVEAFPAEPMRPAVAELPLPDAWGPWERGLFFRYLHRIAPASFALRKPLRADAPERTQRLQTGSMGDIIESYLRTRTGNLYSTQPRLGPKPLWQPYNQLAETLGVQFPGRLRAPLDVHAERSAALVFFLRPAGLPTVFEIESPSLEHWWLKTGEAGE
jgi:hypothetical protein